MKKITLLFLLITSLVLVNTGFGHPVLPVSGLANAPGPNVDVVQVAPLFAE